MELSASVSTGLFKPLDPAKSHAGSPEDVLDRMRQAKLGSSAMQLQQRSIECHCHDDIVVFNARHSVQEQPQDVHRGTGVVVLPSEMDQR